MSIERSHLAGFIENWLKWKKHLDERNVVVPFPALTRWESIICTTKMSLKKYEGKAQRQRKNMTAMS